MTAPAHKAEAVNMPGFFSPGVYYTLFCIKFQYFLNDIFIFYAKTLMQSIVLLKSDIPDGSTA